MRCMRSERVSRAMMSGVLRGEPWYMTIGGIPIFVVLPGESLWGKEVGGVKQKTMTANSQSMSTWIQLLLESLLSLRIAFQAQS
ncbi:hypothetical protein BDV28DRAFT_130492 [Aspergillus coremiiformis]|uniref:Uncharacterized protein n=1 Tax=Aspergillus coremiiformis TaxID=138285 RepID=A0A5N6ZAD4_9EURO|nr:hypothetical protein BDV28DRAFT_130492 [Aspergillus coremiiformis]